MRSQPSRRRFLGATSATLLFGSVDGFDYRSKRREERNRRDQTLNPNLDVGAVYIPFLGDKWGKCIDHHPAIGQYSITETDVINHHVNQMLQNGISTVLFNFGANKRDFDRFLKFRKAKRTNDIAIEIFWVIHRIFQRNHDFAPFLKFVRDEMVSLPNYKTVNDRPVVNFWAPGYLALNEDATRRIENEWGGIDKLFNHIRNELTVDGNEPFLVGGIGSWAFEGFPNAIEQFGRQFDAITSWVGNPKAGYNPWERHRKKVGEIFRRSFWYAIENDLEFVPMVFPGFDDRPNDCWGDGRHVPRSPKHLAELFNLAKKYRTVDRTYVATWNGWPEGHQIEPGTFSGQDYGTAYLDVVKEAATSDLPPFRIESFVPVTLAFNKTVAEHEVNPDKSPENSRDLAFRCSELELLAADGKSVATYNVGQPAAEPHFTEGVYNTNQNDQRSTRWLGGPTTRTQMYFEHELVEKAAELRVRGVPITDDIAADVLVDRTEMDHLEFERNGWQNYLADLRATTTTATTPPTTSESVPTAKTTQQQAMAAEATTTTSVDSPGFGLLTGLGALTLGAGQYLASESDD
ncbi:hypothetical protein [Halorussus sp. MSC15.2]|uniref:hypothetical protein n=1 Tax=Halorussus sp. MSC15.2 TaxID=2283638 RepID=UPI0013D35944|nr:hypothetical protein [Halorussus sp. MSC15.2]NEU58611.1 hypothetical protein [Halorussus sp. MSC15.2]